MSKTKEEMNYGVRRVAYLTAAFAEAYADLSTPGVHTPIASRIAFLLMVRNLDEFFFGKPKKEYPNDLRFSQFAWRHWKLAWRHWKPDKSRQVDKGDRKRLDQTIAHVIDSDPGHFGHRTKLLAFGRPTFALACEFLRECRHNQHLVLDAKANEYLRSINRLLPSIERAYRTVRFPRI